MIPTDTTRLAELIMAEQSPAPKPDLFDRLMAQEGYNRAASFWAQATQWIDAQARDAAITSLKACLQQEPPDLQQAFQDVTAVRSLSHWRLHVAWSALVNAIGDARSAPPHEVAAALAGVLTEIHILDHLEPRD